MNIKGVVGQLLPVDFSRKIDLRKTQNAPDRDPKQDGSGSGQEPERHRFTDAEIADVLQHLQNLDGVRQHNLTVRAENADGHVRVFVESPDGKVIRRINEIELWNIYKSKAQNQQDQRGRLLNKAL